MSRSIVEIKILSGLRLDDLNLALHASAAVDDNLSITGLAAKKLVVILLKAALADDVAGPNPFAFHSSGSSCFGLISPT